MSEDHGTASFTERMVPEEAHARIFWDHIARYRFAAKFARGKRVLDIACGEGYGTSGLAKSGAASAIGVDISAEACARAQARYGVDARLGDAESIPLPGNSVDLVVSFETIEHVASPAQFIGECARVLVPEGMLIVSTPNRPVYSPAGTQNPYHHIEFDECEFVKLLQSKFVKVAVYTQFPQTAAWWSPRSLAAERSPWLRIRGFWRLSSWICPAIRADVPGPARAAADEMVLKPDRFPSSLFNPYVVRPQSKRSRERPYVLIAVAEGVKSAD